MAESLKYKELEDLLDQERHALLAGCLNDLVEISDQKEALISELADSRFQDSKETEDISQKLKRNQALFSSALEGIRNVINNIEGRKINICSLNTYHANGKRENINLLAESKFEKRS